MLSESSVRRAVEHVRVMGDTDIFPRLPEAEMFVDRIDEVVKTISKMQAGQYQATSSVEMLTPKSELGFRITNQLTASDNLMYTAAVLENAEGIEKYRKENSGTTAFSYRYDPAGEARFFETGRSYHDWLAYLSSFGMGNSFVQEARPILETDIADFYQRIYMHRVENLLNDAKGPDPSRKLINNIIQVCRSKQSFGLPVGSSASRLLAEGVLSDTDRMLMDLGGNVTRFVDDYKIIPAGRYNTHSLLCKLAEHLMVTEGLSLNVSKTRVSSTTDVQNFAQKHLEDVFTDSERRNLFNLLSLEYGNEDIDDEDATPLDNLFITGDELLRRLDEIRKEKRNEYSSQKAVLKVLLKIKFFDVVSFVSRHRDLAYYLPRDFCRAVAAGCKHNDVDKAELSKKIQELLHTPPLSELSYARVWLLNLYVNGALDPDRQLVANLDRAANPLEERQLIFMKALNGDRAFFRDQRGRLGHAGEWLKPALLIGASCLPNDEYQHWINLATKQVSDPFAKEMGDWLRKGIDLRKVLHN